MITLSAVAKAKSSTDPPEHHVVAASTGLAASGWASYLPSWAPSPGRTRPSLAESKIAGFQNPWPSWHKPTAAQIWESFQWGEVDDGSIELAASHLTQNTASQKPEPSKRPHFGNLNDWPNSLGAKAARLLRIEDPDFAFPSGSRAKATWLGHASVLVQLSPLQQGGRPVRCLFDPIFSTRCSPSQYVGPIRSYPPPCKAEDLPPIDVVAISHNHLDHMDEASLKAIWRQNKDTVRFFIPLRNKKWLLDMGIPSHRIVEMDWFDSAQLTHSNSASTNTLKVWCTPAQHNSFRTGADADSSLWSSWTLEYLTPTSPPYRVFFAGDTGYQFHPSPSWPPSPNPKQPPPPGDGPSKNNSTSSSTSSTASPSSSPKTPSEKDKEEFPPCPAFSQIKQRIGPPNLLLLPVSVGATFAYLRSFVPLPDWINPFPRHRDGVTGANHMPPWDAVRVLKEMTDATTTSSSNSGEGGVEEVGVGEEGEGEGGGGERQGEGDGGDVEGAVAMAMHWGTFVTVPAEVLTTLGGLEWACSRQGVGFGRGLEEREKGKPWFVAVNHGGSVCV